MNLKPDATIDELEILSLQGVYGVRLNWWRKKQLPDIRTYRELLAKMRAMGWHLELFIDGFNMPEVLPTIKASGVNVVFDHFGCPDPVKGVSSEGFGQLLDLVATGCAWVKLSAPYRLDGGNARLYADVLFDYASPIAFSGHRTGLGPGLRTA